MARPHQFSEPAQLIAFVLQKGNDWNAGVLDALQKTWGPVRHLGKFQPFDRTDYYAPEMGGGLFRAPLSFERIVPPELIGEEKKRSNALEEALSRTQSSRDVNIDIGYMDLDKAVLPSFKRGPFKIYAGGGLWLDMILTYAKGKFHPTAWAFDDFVRDPYEHDLLLIREKFKKANAESGK
jgi:hypothetical protein